MQDTQRKACLSCRQRKLKCDKRQPCANCTTRSVECKEQHLAPVSRGIKRTLDAADQPTGAIPDILARLDRLEAYISAPQNNHSQGLVSDTIINAVNDSVSAVAGASKAATSAATTANTPSESQTNISTARNSGYEVSLGQLTANDNILVCLVNFARSTLIPRLTTDRAKHWYIHFTYLSRGPL